MSTSPYKPIFQYTRGDLVESIQYGSIAVVTSDNQLYAWYGNPNTITFLRSTSKPFQALKFIESNGAEKYHLTPEEIALICASHLGTDRHIEVVKSIQSKTGVKESDLLCGVHAPIDKKTADQLNARGEKASSNHNNCSGKHTGMLAFARLRNYAYDPELHPYIDPGHPVQKEIIKMFSFICGIQPEEVHIGIDGCSVPNFAVPLKNAALGYARLADPTGLSNSTQEACKVIFNAMTSNPFMVGGPGSFDTALMEATRNKIVSKGGAEGYQGIGIKPGVLASGSPGIGIAFKIADGDSRNHARSAVALEILKQLNVLTVEEEQELSAFGPSFPLFNHRKLTVGAAAPKFQLDFQSI